MARIVALLAAGLLAIGCGSEDEPDTASQPPAEEPPATETAKEKPTKKKPAAANAKGTEIVLAGSDFGSMLYDSRKQAIYIFELDEKGESACYGECAAAWPPVYTKGKPVAGRGVDASLLGTVKRRDGRRQVTYAGQPLYFYAHEEPGQVLCHNVDLNGGLWWVVGPDGKRRA
jgi:predicted lipoprotein with Yx(FWY)xxD motif